MTKQRRKPRNRPIGNMSFVERAGLVFGVVGLFADFTVLFTFATGVANINQYLPKTIPTSSSLLFFALTTALLIIYGWFAVSWYLVRRSFVLLGQMPVRFHYPLVGRSLRTVSGIGFVLIPLIIAWSVGVIDHHSHSQRPRLLPRVRRLHPSRGSFWSHFSHDPWGWDLPHPPNRALPNMPSAACYFHCTPFNSSHPLT